MIGTPWIYYLLFYLDPDYRKFFVTIQQKSS